VLDELDGVYGRVRFDQPLAERRRHQRETGLPKGEAGGRHDREQAVQAGGLVRLRHEPRPRRGGRT
jgi:hypothetical protein